MRAGPEPAQTHERAGTRGHTARTYRDDEKQGADIIVDGKLGIEIELAAEKHSYALDPTKWYIVLSDAGRESLLKRGTVAVTLTTEGRVLAGTP